MIPKLTETRLRDWGVGVRVERRNRAFRQSNHQVRIFEGLREGAQGGRMILIKSKVPGRAERISQAVLKSLDFGLRAMGSHLSNQRASIWSYTFCVSVCVCISYLELNSQGVHFYIVFEEGYILISLSK